MITGSICIHWYRRECKLELTELSSEYILDTDLNLPPTYTDEHLNESIELVKSAVPSIGSSSF